MVQNSPDLYVSKFEIRISKLETISKFKCSNDKNYCFASYFGFRFTLLNNSALRN